MLIKLSNNPQIQYFSPVWNIELFQFQVEDELVRQLEELTMIKEHRILKQFAHLESFPYGYGNIGPDSTTAKFRYYNIFSWQESPAREFTNIVKEQHNEFRKELGLEPQNVYGKCWVNILRKGQNIPPHNHSSLYNPYSYLSGHLTVKTQNTSTHYGVDYGSLGESVLYSAENKPGLLTLFPSTITHWSDVYQGDDVRITIAFDLMLNRGGHGSGEDNFPMSPTVEFKYD